MQRGVRFLLICVVFSILISGFVVAEVMTDETGRALGEDEQCMAKCMVNSGLTPGKDCGPGTPDGPECDECKKQCFDFKASGDPTKDLYEVQQEYVGEEIADAGLTPDSAFYFVDDFFSNFGDEIQNREEKVAEIKAMIREGNYDAARKALERYKENADKLEQNLDPEKRVEARRSAAAIKNALDEIKDEIPEDQRDEFYDGIVAQEGSIVTAVEISSKIKELCIQLSELDPEKFYDTCKIGNEGQKWQQDMYKDLTEEQKVEAKKFAGIMKRCFKSSGQDCDCDSIPFPEFAKSCSIAAPLATKCDIQGDESACDELDNLEMPELPPHLQGIMDELEKDVKYEKFDLHMPKECVAAGATTPKECSKIMIEFGAPPECKKAMLDSGCISERECSEICDKIMMEKHSPECAEKGITDPEECKDFMWNIDRRPPECVSHQIHDYRDCQDFLAKGGTFKQEGPMINFDCKSITDPTERLKCFDNAASGFGDFKMNFEDTQNKERECADKCHSEGRPWAFEGGNCQCGNPGQYYGGPDRGFYDESECKDGCSQECPGASRTDCISERCKCYYEEEHREEYREEFHDESEEIPEEETIPEGGSETEETEVVEEETGGESGESESVVESSESSGGGESGITGEVFLDYMY